MYAADPILNGQNKVFECTEKVLVADDDLFMRSLVKKILGPYIDIVSLKHGDEVLETYLEEKPAMCLIDVHLPGRSGLKLIGDILKRDPNAHIIMMSADSTKENVMLSKDRGAKGFVTKPFDHDKLIDLVRACPYIETIN